VLSGEGVCGFSNPSRGYLSKELWDFRPTDEASRQHGRSGVNWLGSRGKRNERSSVSP
jgi:hypothetical protein